MDGFARLVDFDVFADVGDHQRLYGGKRQRLLRGFHSVFKIAGFGVSGGQRVEIGRDAPVRCADAAFSQLDGFFSIAQFRIKVGRIRPREAIERVEIFRFDGERVLEKRFAVFPKAQLPRGKRGQNRERRYARDSADPARQNFRDAPRDDDENADRRNVGVAIGHRLTADLHDADDRHERAEIPKPADRKKFAACAEFDDGGRHGNQRDSGERDRERIEIVARAIGHDESRGPQQNAEIARVRNYRVAEPRVNRHVFERHHGAGRFLHDERDKTRSGRQREERNFFHREMSQLRRRAKPFQRPVIEQQQHKRKRHEHRLGHESEREKERDKSEAAHARLLGVARVREQREDEKKSAQHILALGDPCDRFDVRGMPREQRRDRRARPRSARHTQQREKQQHGIRRVQQDVNEMLWAGTRAEQLPVEHVREPRERMPVRGVAAAERPGDAGRRDAAGQMRVVNHV